MPLQNQQPTILAVDDSPVMREIIKQALVTDYNVLVADCAAAALSLIYQQPIAMLLLDVCMPEVSGLELCRTLRSLPQFGHLPIMMVTSKDKVFDKVQGRLAGANEYLTKPFDVQKLRETCRQILTLQSATTTSEQ